jgi:NodT family efflux transporter outer membrane factor (OMF) lipoprotein
MSACAAGAPRIRRSAIGALALVLAGCAVGPDFKKPAAPAHAGYTPAGSAPASATASAPGAGGEAQHFVDGLDIPGQWWTLFQSPDLNGLIERALKQNPTLESAQAALRQADENVAAERGALLPSLSGTYEAQRNRSTLAQFGLPGSGAYYYTLNNAQVNVSYTIDAFGGIRRQIEALQAQADYARYSLEASYLALTANVVTAAVSEASLRAQVAAQEDIAHAQQAQLDITQRRFTAGGASKADVLLQQSTLQATLAALPQLRTQLAQERDLLATYVGSLPNEYSAAPFNLDTLKLPVDLPVSLPSKLVEQRPDVLEYSALLHQATAQIGVATANMLPQLTLTGSYGGVAQSHFADMFSPSSVVWGIAGKIAQPLFQGGQLMHQRRAAVAAAQEAAANYKATVLTAFQNVADSLLALSGDADVLAAQTAAERSAAGSLDLTRAQYKAGGASQLQVLTAEQTYQNAAVALVKARAQRFTDTAALFQALGGGWWNRNDALADISSTPRSPQAQ